jgi:hypothetical protein
MPFTFKDASTVFSIVPFAISESKPGIYPGIFNIPACMDEQEPTRLCIDKPSKHMMMVGGKKDPIAIDTPSYELARSVVDDFLSDQIFSSPEAHPGLIWIQGELSVNEFKTKYMREHVDMIKTQDRWFLKIISETDQDWNKTHNLRVASNQARFAARKFGLDKEWLRDEQIALEHDVCPACSTKNPPRNVICMNCKCVLKPALYEKLQFAGV